jgi:hypothetical protein
LNVEDELLLLAREREDATQAALHGMPFEPDYLRRQLREYLSRQVRHARMKRTDDRIPRLAAVPGGLNELTCPGAEFADGGRLLFDIQLEESQRGWLVKRFRFHLHLPPSRNIKMVRIHLNPETWHDPVRIPRCHLHVGDSSAHIPFPIMNPRLILSLICEHIEPDFGVFAGQSGAGSKTRHRP